LINNISVKSKIIVAVKTWFQHRRFRLVPVYISFLFPIVGFSQVKPGRVNSEQNLKYKIVSDQKDAIEAGINKILDNYIGKPDSPSTWTVVRQEITGFLFGKWHAGILQGIKQDQAFYVKVDQTTMTQSDINQKKLIVLVGLAFMRPVEFEVMRFEKQL
jgi:phage tail sheath protein FI